MLCARGYGVDNSSRTLVEASVDRFSLDEPVERGADAIEVVVKLRFDFDVSEDRRDIEASARLVRGPKGVAKPRFHVAALRTGALRAVERDAAGCAPQLARDPDRAYECVFRAQRSCEACRE
jgi:hypothetical protein